jgi:hypothetical protein
MTLKSLSMNCFRKFKRLQLTFQVVYGDRHRLAVALQIGMLKMTGRTLDAFETVPPPVLRHLQRIFPAHFGERRIISEGYLNPCSIM